MISMRYKPYFLPQVSAPYNIVVDKFDEESITYKLIEVDPVDLKPLQGIVFSDEVNNANICDDNPIYVDNDYHVLDGHHRFIKALSDGSKLKAIMVDLPYMDACRVLNKIQDIYEYEQSQGLEEVEVQDTINYYGDDDNQFLNSIDSDNLVLQEEKPSKNEQTVIAYRKEPIKEESVIGNFFILNPINGYSKYEITFDNLLDTDVLGISLKDSQSPVDVLCKIWFPYINFDELSKKNNVPVNNLKNKAIAEKAMMMGYDGIKYGNKIIQGLK